MKSFIRYGTVAAALAAALTMAPAAYSADEVIKIAPNTRSVGVRAGETVEFIDQQTGQSFTEHFDQERLPVDLNEIAPAGALGGQHVKVYVWGQEGVIDG
jgi:hypothetical protein